jgi:hypothetical protein
LVIGSKKACHPHSARCSSESSITTTAVFAGLIEVCIDYSGITFQDESQLKLFHFEDGAWVDHTTSLDTVNNSICARVSSLSPFAIFQ